MRCMYKGIERMVWVRCIWWDGKTQKQGRVCVFQNEVAGKGQMQGYQ